jgi:predicted phosphodiesterase
MGMKAKSVPNKAVSTGSRAKTLVAKGEDGDTAAARAEHIAKKIGECAEAMKVEPCDLTWADFRSYGSVAYGENNLGIVRRDITRLGGFNALRDAHFPPEATAYAGVKKRVREHANLNRRLGVSANDDEFQFQRIEEFASRVFSGRVKFIPPPKAAPIIKRAVVMCLGDDHWGADLLKTETGAHDFGKVEEARCVAKCVKEMVEFNVEHRAETELHVVLLGDFIHGCLHDMRDGAVLSEQQSRAIHLLIQFVAHASAAYPKVTVHGVTGNHGRDKSRHIKQATSGKFDSREMLIYSAVKMATRALTNVTWDLPLSAFCVFKIFGKKYFVTHGDGVIKVGNPGQSINVSELEKQTNRLNATLRDKDEYSVVIVGHVHQSARVLLNNGVTVIVNGAGTPVDAFAVSIGIFESVSSQQIFEVVPGFPVGAGYPIMLDESVYQDESLDKLVKPWTEY